MSATVRKDHAVLAGLLAVQLLLAIVTWTVTGSGPEETAGSSALFEAALDDVTRVEIVGAAASVDEEPARVELTRDGEDWLLASADGYPARTDKAEELVEALLGMRVGDVIATNRSSHESLRVGERQYDRRVTLATDDGRETVILGSGPRSSVNVRREDENEVRVARGAGIHSLRADARNYVELEYVQVDKDDLTRVEVTNEHGRLLFTKSEDGWALAGLPDAAGRDEAAVATFINNVARMTLQAPVGKELDPSFGLDDGARVVLAAEGDDSTIYADYVIGTAADERSYYAKAADSEFVVTVPKWGGEQIRNKKLDDFVKQPAQ